MAIEKNSAEAAEMVLIKAYPEPHERFLVLRQLLKSIEHAQSIAPGAWCVTLLRQGFRLNVGDTEVLLGFPGGIGLNLAAKPEDFNQSEDYEILEINYAARPGSTRYNTYVENFKKVEEELKPAHLAFIDDCAFTATGKPFKKSRFQRFHSPGLVEYAQNFVSGYA